MEFRHIGIGVKDLKAMTAFYKKVFGMAVISKQRENGEFMSNFSGFPGYDVTTVKMGVDNKVMVEFLYFHHLWNDPHRCDWGFIRTGLSHFALTVPSATKVHGKVIKNGGQCLSSPLVNDAKTHKVFFCSDPERNYIEIVEELS